MAQQTSTATKKATPKRATTAKTTARKTATRKTTVRKTAKATASKRSKKVQLTAVEQAQEIGRKIYLAGLGVYGKVFDSVEDQLKVAEKNAEARRKSADKLVTELVKRGEKLEKQAKKSIDGIELPGIDRAEIDLQLEKAKDRLNELKDSLNFRSAA